MSAPHKIARPTIGFAGVGLMGNLMAQRLLRAGYSVTAYNRTREKLRDVVAHGGQVAETPRELAAQNDVIISCVSNDAALEAIMYGRNGVLAGAVPPSILIDMSTVSPEASRKLSAAAQAQGVSMIDAPVSGSTPVAREGQLVIFVGGERAVYDKCKPVLDVLGRAVLYLGPNGAGTIMKLVVNAILGVEMQAIAEAVSLGTKAGLEQETLLEALSQTAVIAQAHRGKLENIKKGEYPTQFALPMMRKDFGLVNRLANEHAVPMPTTVAAEQICTAAVAQGLDADFSVVAQVMGTMAGVETRKDED